MRKELCDALVSRALKSDKMVFMTGDLGFMALEPLQEVMGERFINAGVAEQNMVTVAAAMAREDLDVWIYSIAPFCYARPFEQIRNDVAFHGLPVKIIGNGGGYGYGVMGPTHHAIEDYGILLSLPGMKSYVPAFNEDIDATIERAGNLNGPSYLRLGRGEAPAGYVVPEYSAWRQVVNGGGKTVISVGPVAGTYIAPFAGLAEDSRPNFWILSELPQHAGKIPPALVEQISNGRELCIIEEHVKQGSFASAFVLGLAEKGISLKSFSHFCAKAHHYDSYGSQSFLRAKSGLSPQEIVAAVTSAAS